MCPANTSMMAFSSVPIITLSINKVFEDIILTNLFAYLRVNTVNGLPSPCMALCRRCEALSGSWFPPAGLTVPFKGKGKTIWHRNIHTCNSMFSV